MKSARRGRPATPTKLKVLQGTYRPTRDQFGEEAERGIQRLKPGDPPPRWLRGAHQIKAWREFVSTLGELEIVTVGDVYSVAMLCDAFGRFLTARDIILAEGEIIDGPRGPMSHPAYRHMVESWNQVKGMMIEFGLTPAARSRVTKVGGEDNEDPFEKWNKGDTERPDADEGT